MCVCVCIFFLEMNNKCNKRKISIAHAKSNSKIGAPALRLAPFITVITCTSGQMIYSAQNFFFSDISERNKDYSDILDFRRGRGP